MKKAKKLLSIILAILMIVTTVPVAFAADGHTHALTADGENLEFTEFPVGTGRIETAGNYYLTQDIELTDNLWIDTDGTINLCLNGHSITVVKNNSNQTALFLKKGILNLCDCQGGGCITSAEDLKASGLRALSGTEFNMYSGEIKDNYYYAVSGGEFNMYGGKLSGNKRAAVYVIDTFNMYGGEISDNSNEYGAVYVDGGDFTMYDGEIKNNINTSTIWNRGTVFVNSGAFTMKGGKITGNTSGSSCGGVCSYENFVMEGGEISDNSGELGGVAVVSDKFIMNGGKISGNTANYGGGVWLNQNSSFIMNGGEISGNSAEQGGGVYSTYDSAKIELKKGVITGNTATYGGGVGAQYFNTPVEISGADVQIMGNTPNMSRGSITVSAPLDSEKTKIYVDVFDGEIIARPDGTNLTTLKGMEGCFITSDEDILVVCNEDGELEAVFWNSSIEEINGDLVVKTTVNDNVTYQWYEVNGEELTKLDGETSAKITHDKLVIGKTYACRIYLAGGEIETLTIEYNYAITHQPTAEEPYVELNDDTDATYQWYTLESDVEEITDQNASGDWQSKGAPFGNSVYEDGKWVADTFNNLQYYFMIELEAGQTINIEFASEVENIIFSIFDTAAPPDFTEINDSQYSITVEESGVYWLVVYGTPVDYARATLGGFKYIPIEGETSAELQNPTFGNNYACKVTCGDGETVLTSDAFEYSYAITHQPTEAEPYVELNDDTDASYQWYKIEGDGEEITDKNASGDWQSLEAPFGNTVYEDGKWIADSWNGQQYYFMVDLEAGETINLEFASDVEAIVFGIDGEPTGGVTEVGASEHSITVEESGTYWLVVLGTPVDYVCATIGNIEYTPIEGATSATFNPAELGKYACEVTFRDGTKEMSDSFVSNHTCDFTGEWKYDSEKHWKECTCGETDKEAEHTFTDGKCDCGYECPHEETYYDIIRPVQNADGTWGKGTAQLICVVCGPLTPVEEVERNHEGYKLFDETAAKLELLLGRDDIIPTPKESMSNSLRGNRNAAYSRVYTDLDFEKEMLASMTKNVNDMLVELEARIADGMYIKADFSYLVSLLNEINALVDNNPENIISSFSVIYADAVNFYKNNSNNPGYNQNAYDYYVNSFDLENQLEKLIAGLKDGTALKADYTAIDEAIAEIEEKLGDVELTDEAKAGLEEIKAELEEMKADGNTSAADLAELEKALEDYETELDAGIEDGSAVKVDGLGELGACVGPIEQAIKEKYGEIAYQYILNSMSDEDEAERRAILSEAMSLTGSLKDNEDKLAELKGRTEALLAKIENCLNGTHNGLKFEVTEEAKCGENAIESATCTLCGETVTREVENSALTHSFTKYEETEAPKCGVEGKEVAYCDHGCGETDEKAIEALKHSFTKYEVTEEAKCGVEGKEVAYCDHGCGETDEKAIEALTHSFTNYVETVAPTCGAEGKKVASCDNGCGATDEIAIEAIKHLFYNYTYNEDATCEADGTMTGICAYCGEPDTITAVDTKLDHVDEDGDKLCDECETEIKDVCPNCGGSVHEGPYSEYICMLRMLIKLVVAIVMLINAIA